MTTYQMLIVLLAVPATVYQVINLLVMHGSLARHGNATLKVSWWAAIILTTVVQMSALSVVLDVTFG